MGFGSGGGSSSVAGSSDVALNTPINNDVLTYDSATSKWKNAVGGAGGAVSSVAGKTGTVTLVKGDVGLGNVDNTSDANKPVSNATQTALNAKATSSTLAPVATSGSYTDLTDKPNIPLDATTSGRIPEKHLAPYRNVFSPLPIITLRYDDNNIKDLQIANALTAAGLVGSFATVRNWIGQSGSKTTLQNILDFQAAGHEITAHTRTHQPVSTDTVFYDEVITATDEMRAMNLYIQCFTEPGTGGPAQYKLDSMDKLSSSYYGLLMQSNFAASQAYIYDGLTYGVKQHPNALRWGYGHTTWESDNNAVYRFVERVINANGSGEILTHLAQLDAANKITTQQYLDFITWLAAQRDAGRLLVMTPTAASYAQRGDRLNMLIDPSLDVWATQDHQYSNWSYASGFSPGTGRTGGYALRVAPGTGVSQTFMNAEVLRSMEMSAWFKSIGAAGVTRLQFQTYSDITATTLLKTTYRNVNIGADVWTKVIFNCGVSPDTKAVKFSFMSESGSTQMWVDDAAVYRT